LIRYLPLIYNPLQKGRSLGMQLNGEYISKYIKKGIINSKKDIDEI
jgi:hypothetical protein